MSRETHVRFCERVGVRFPGATHLVVLCNGTREEAETMREKLRKFLADELKLTLSMEKTRITHLDDGFLFLGYGVRRHMTGTGQKLTKLLIPVEAQRRCRRAVLRTTAHSSANHSVNAKFMALNMYLRGWANYYRYAYNASKVFAGLDNVVFWQTAHWLGRKFKCSMAHVMRRFYRRVNGVKTLATDEFAVVRLASIGHRRALAKTFANPYTMTEQTLVRPDEFGLEHTWFGEERRLGMADLRPLALERDLWSCRNCGTRVTNLEARIDHVRPVSRFKRPVDANVLPNLQTLCEPCHAAKTESDRQMESRMR